MAHFVDTNIWGYAVSTDAKTEKALSLIEGAVVSVQVLNEFTNAARKRWGFSWEETNRSLAFLSSLCSRIDDVTAETNRVGRALADRYQLSVYDGFMVAVAWLAECDTLFSEDMHHGLVIEKRLKIVNPFA